MIHLIRSSYFQNLLESFPSAVIIFNIQGEAYAANEHAVSLLERPRDVIMGKNWSEIFDGLEPREEFEEFMETARTPSDQQPILSARYQQDSGGLAHLSLTCSWLIEYEKIFGILLSMTDVTHIVEMHEREKQILTEKNKLQKERFESLRKLSMAVAHQIRNPVMSMSGLAALMQKKFRPDKKEAEFIKGIMEGGKRLESIVRVVGEFTSIKRGERRQVNVAALVGEARARAVQRAKSGSNLVQWEMAEQNCTVNTDPGLLMDALEELLVNSLEALEGREGSVAVRSLPSEDGCRLEVVDNGPGIDPDDLGYIFDPFYTTKPYSVGMGLTKAQRILRELGGDIEIESELGRGVRAVVRHGGEGG